MARQPEPALVAAIEKAGGTIRLGTRLETIRKVEGEAGFTLDLAGDAAPIHADRLLVCTPAYVAAAALEGLDAGIAAGLREIPYLSTGTVTLAYRRADVPHSLDASGLINGSGRLNAGSYLLNNATYDIDFGSGNIVSGTIRMFGIT